MYTKVLKYHYILHNKLKLIKSKTYKTNNKKKILHLIYIMVLLSSIIFQNFELLIVTFYKTINNQNFQLINFIC